MSTLTISAVDDELRRKLAERAKANHRTIEAEALCCLQAVVAADDDALAAISAESWKAIEQSVCDSIHEQGTPLTEADFQRYRGLARGDDR